MSLSHLIFSFKDFVSSRFSLLTKFLLFNILQDGHEICFVGDESYRELSKFDPEGEKLLDRYIKKDEERKAN